MEISFTLLVTLFVAFVIVICATADLEVSGTSNDSIDNKNLRILKQNIVGNEKVVNPESKGKSIDTKNLETSKESNIGNEKVGNPKNKGKDQVDGGFNKKVGKNVVDSDEKGSSKQLGLKEAGKEQKKTSDSSSSDKVDQKKKVREGSDSESKKETLPAVRKEGLRVEECDSSSNTCTTREIPVVACLRVPGNESPDLSLLIQNKGKGTVSVTISAPAFVKLEKKQIQLQENENKKVKVSIGKGGPDNIIKLKVGNDNCLLDFKDLIAQASLKDNVLTSRFASINFFRGKSSTLFLFLGVFLVIASLWTFISIWRKHSARNSSRYEKLDMELPVSGDSKRASESNDGWDNSWDDSWDDEEAPQTSSMPVTPSLSTKGIAARRLNREGWKD